MAAKKTEEKAKPKARRVTYHVICNDCWKSIDEDSHGGNWRYNRTKDACEHCADDDKRQFRFSIPEGLTVII